MLATSLASAMPSVAYAEIIKRNATSSTTAMAQNYLNKGTSSLAGLSYSKLLSNSSKYSFITDATLLPTLYSNWRAADVDSWYFYGDDGSVKTGWVYDHGWYYLSTEEEGTAGLMRYGWYQDNEGSWYFLNTIHDGTFGRAVSGWQWIDGYSYYFDSNCKLVTSGQIGDGYTVDSDGRWTVDGVVQYVEGKGLTTQIVYLDSNMASNVASDSTPTSDDDSSSSSNGSGDNSTSSGSGTASGDNTDGTKTDSTESDSTSEDEKDSDGDGVPDWLEEYLVTSSSSSDTDGDGISDYDEIYIIGSDPIVNDSNEDADSDGISNFDEINTYKTDPTSKDTDGDTLSDYDEIFVYYADPLKADTDGDGISDADEIAYGFDPLVADSDGNGTPDGQERITITASYDGESIAQPTAQITLQAGAAASVNIERDDPTTSIWMTEDVPGMLDAMYDFTVDGQIEEATLTFSFTEDESADFYPAIYYVDTENQEMTELENQVVDWEAKTVTATTTHFSGYVALNKVEQDRAWSIKIIEKSAVNTDARLDIAFAIDESKTMSIADPDLGRVAIAESILDILRTDDRASVSGFDIEGRVYQAVTDNFTLVRQSLAKIKNGSVLKEKTLSGGIWAGIFSLTSDDTSWNPYSVMTMASATSEDNIEDILITADDQDEDVRATASEALAGLYQEILVATASEAYDEDDNYDDTDMESVEPIGPETTYISAVSEVVESEVDDEDILVIASDDSEYTLSTVDMESHLTYLQATASDTDETMKIIILMTDAKGVAYAPAYAGAIEAGIEVYTLQFGEGGNTQLLQNIAEYTGGRYYHESEVDKLIADLTELIGSDIDIETDSDSDGLSDYHEERIRIFTGQIISLDKYNADTDGDSLLDGQEIVMTKDSEGRVFFEMKTNPCLVDSDFDGIDDDEDNCAIDNSIDAMLKTEFSAGDINFTMNFKNFFKDNTKYNKDISKVSVIFATIIYEWGSLWIYSDESHDYVFGGGLETILSHFGFSHAKTIDIDADDNHVSEVGLGHRDVTVNGETKTILSVVVRGTNGTIKEWASNFDIGCKAGFPHKDRYLDEFTSEDTAVFKYLANNGYPDEWQTYEHHAAFDIIANRIIKEIDEYISEYDLDKNEITYWITGHSRGAAAANIIGKYFTDEGKETFVYTFASPNTTLVDEEEAASYRTIFNIVNGNDFVPQLPIEKWGYKKYGRTVVQSIDKLYEKEWEALTGLLDYNPDTIGLNKTITTIANIVPDDVDARVELYRYTCSCHGDRTKNNITIRNRGTSEESREEAIAKIPKNALPYCMIQRYEGFMFAGWDFTVCQTPTYLFQLIAAKMSGAIGTYRFVVELNIANRYEDAKYEIAHSAVGGLEHPHYLESYYTLANNVKEGDFYE